MAFGSVKIRKTSEFMSCLIAEERERSECSIGLPVSTHSRAATEPPPTFPFLESQCQRAALRHELYIMPEKQSRPQERASASGADGVYREVLPACQTGNAAVLRKFRRAEKCRQFRPISASSRGARTSKATPACALASGSCAIAARARTVVKAYIARSPTVPPSPG
jgi:hypothetical protein